MVLKKRTARAKPSYARAQKQEKYAFICVCANFVVPLQPQRSKVVARKGQKMSEKVVILAIESSCDDTSAAVIVDGILRSNVIASQKVHEEFGGVVPELASRAHQQNILLVVDTALKRAGEAQHNAAQC